MQLDLDKGDPPAKLPPTTFWSTDGFVQPKKPLPKLITHDAGKLKRQVKQSQNSRHLLYLKGRRILLLQVRYFSNAEAFVMDTVL